jgi:NAD(P)H-dependent flavin oxidoreductase YrpB (nitropropane dioxygenase family)
METSLTRLLSIEHPIVLPQMTRVFTPALMGTRLATVQECPLHHRTREEILSRAGADTVYTDRFDGMDCRILRTASAERILRRRRKRCNGPSSREIWRRA